MRVILKTSTELNKIRTSGRILGVVLKELKRMILPGVTTLQLEKAAEEIIGSFGAEPSFKNYRGYPYSICTSINNEIVHGFPSERELLFGDVISVDCGVLHDGYHADAAFTKLVGHTSNKLLEQLITTTDECLQLAIEVTKAGVTTGTIGSTIQKHAEANNFHVIENYVGHGIGRDLHEYPQVKNYGEEGSGIVLKAGAVIAIEPMLVLGEKDNIILSNNWTVVTSDGSKATHVEKTVIIHEGFCEPVTVF